MNLTTINKLKRENAELLKENAKLYRNLEEMRESGAVKDQKELFAKIVRDNEELKKGAAQVQASVNAIMKEVIEKYGKDGYIRINKPLVGSEPYEITSEVIGSTMVVKLKRTNRT